MNAAGADGAASGQGGDVHVDRLTLRVAGLDEDAARSLARLVAEGLAPGLLRSAGTAGLDRLRVRVTTDQRAPDLLARRIVAEAGRVLARDRVAGGPDGEAHG
ncbi:MAG TPA: hypothetical protein VMD59_06840 [Acidimicrobiales bacterium]|nr:hypothetical protein [Acidimicrobiales bacterium]